MSPALRRYTAALAMGATPCTSLMYVYVISCFQAHICACVHKEVMLEHTFFEKPLPTLWRNNPELGAAFDAEPFTQDVDEDVRSFAGSLGLPYCGANTGFAAARWLDDGGSAVQSLALLPLRHGAGPGPESTFGLLVLGSPDPTRYSADMGTEFLMRIGDVASAALSRLRPAP